MFFLLLAAVPFLDRSPERWWRRRPVSVSIASLVALTLVVLTVLMAVLPRAEHLG